MDFKRKHISPEIVALEMSGRFLMGPDCRQMDKEIDALVQSNHKRVILDFSGVIQIDSAGVGQVVKSFTKVKNAGGDLRLAGVKGMLEGVFKMTQVHKVIEMFPNAEAATQGF